MKRKTYDVIREGFITSRKVSTRSISNANRAKK